MSRARGQIIPRGPKTWLIRVFNGRDANGKRQYHSKTVHGTKVIARQYLTMALWMRERAALLSALARYTNSHGAQRPKI